MLSIYTARYHLGLRIVMQREGVLQLLWGKRVQWRSQAYSSPQHLLLPPDKGLFPHLSHYICSLPHLWIAALSCLEVW